MAVFFLQSAPSILSNRGFNPLELEKPLRNVTVSALNSTQTTADSRFQFDPIEAALADIQSGRAVVVVDDENRENEGDVICAAQFATPEMINFMSVQARGLICLAMTGERLDALDLPLMVTNNTDPNQTAFTVSIDAYKFSGF